MRAEKKSEKLSRDDFFSRILIRHESDLGCRRLAADLFGFYRHFDENVTTGLERLVDL